MISDGMFVGSQRARGCSGRKGAGSVPLPLLLAPLFLPPHTLFINHCLSTLLAQKNTKTTVGYWVDWTCDFIHPPSTTLDALHPHRPIQDRPHHRYNQMSSVVTKGLPLVHGITKVGIVGAGQMGLGIGESILCLSHARHMSFTVHSSRMNRG